jgi:ABC-type nitrate/sulfonate/bicarbonate transport system permease component
MRDFIILVAAYGVAWSGFHFWGFERQKKKVLADPQEFSERTVRFYTESTTLEKALWSVLVALSVPVGIAIILGIARFLFDD